MKRQSWYALLLGPVFLAGVLGADDNVEVPLVLRAVPGDSCEVEGSVGTRKRVTKAMAFGKVVGVEGIDGPEVTVEAYIWFPGIDETWQSSRLDVADGLFRSSAVFLREEAVSCREGRFVVEGLLQSWPVVEVGAPGCLSQLFRLEAAEEWFDVKLQCGSPWQSV